VISELAVSQEDRKFLAEYLADWVDVNVYYSQDETLRRRNIAAAGVEPVFKTVARGTTLIHEGERVDEAKFAEISAVRLASQGKMGFEELFSLLFLISLLAFFLHRYATYHQRHFHKIDHLHALLVGLMLVVLLLTKSVLWLAGMIATALSYPFDQMDAYIYLSPLAAAPIIVALLANGRIAMVYSSFSAVIFGAMCGLDYSLFMWALLVQWAAIYAISSYSDRAALLRAGFIVGAIGSFLALVLTVVDGTLWPWQLSVAKAGFAFVGGAVGVGLVVSFALPLLERVFGVLTDVRLLELSNAEHPLLKELAIKAPGTYNHSLVVGTLSQEAARAIGANGLFCRVAASYHDIGKMLKPEYYVENQRGVNPHDKLSPSMSALIIAAHVKDGIKLAREAGLPDQIIDIIPQHHGSRLMSYFYDKAKQKSDPAVEQVKEKEFRYPGPKPQTREGAILMIADGVEAAAKSLDEPTPNRLGEVIRKITNAIVMEGQLEECDLTFTDLRKVQSAFLQTLLSMYHQRVDYPGYDFDSEEAPS
jgi:putative nucleotidyltransferase with HDIG domain